MKYHYYNFPCTRLDFQLWFNLSEHILVSCYEIRTRHIGSARQRVHHLGLENGKTGKTMKKIFLSWSSNYQNKLEKHSNLRNVYHAGVYHGI